MLGPDRKIQNDECQQAFKPDVTVHQVKKPDFVYIRVYRGANGRHRKNQPQQERRQDQHPDIGKPPMPFESRMKFWPFQPWMKKLKQGH